MQAKAVPFYESSVRNKLYETESFLWLQCIEKLSEDSILWERELTTRDLTRSHQISNKFFKESNSKEKFTQISNLFLRRWSGNEARIHSVQCTFMWDHSLNLTARPNFQMYSGSLDSEFNCYYYYNSRSSFTGRDRKTLAVEIALFCMTTYQTELSFTETWTKLLKCDVFSMNKCPKNKRTLIIIWMN